MKWNILIFTIFCGIYHPSLAQYDQPDGPAAAAPAPALPKPTKAAPAPEIKPSLAVIAPKPQVILPPAPPKPQKPASKVNTNPAKVNLPRVNRPNADLSCFADNLFVVDSTSSVKEIFEQHRAYVENVANALAIGENGHHIGVIEYSSPIRHFVKISFADKQKKENVLKRIQHLRFMNGITATGAAIEQAINELSKRRANVQANVIVITDGFSYDHVEDASRKLHAVPNVNVYAVSVGDVYREPELNTIASSTDNVFHGSDTYTALLKKINPCGDRAVLQEDTPPPLAYEAPVTFPPKPSKASKAAPRVVATTRAPPPPPTTRRTTTRRPVTPFTVKPHPFGISPFICNPNDPTVVNCKDRGVFERKIMGKRR